MKFEGTTTPARSAIMRGIRGKNTAAEILLRQSLWKLGFRYRIHENVEGTRPDIVFLRKRLAVFVDGCFWHGCPQHYKAPRKNEEFWRAKIIRNSIRDTRDTLRLQLAGWRVLRVWECEIRTDLEGVVERVGDHLRPDG